MSKTAAAGNPAKQIEIYAGNIANRWGDAKEGVTCISPANHHLLPEIVNYILAGSHNTFEFIHIADGMSAYESLQNFAREEHRFLDPWRQPWYPNLSEALRAPDTAEGCLAALRSIVMHYPRTIVLIGNTQQFDPSFVELFKATILDARLVILQ